MALVADTGALYALYDADDAHHTAVTAELKNENGPVIIPMAILAEVVYLLRAHLSIDAEIDFLESIVRGAFVLEPLFGQDLKRCLELVKKYREFDFGLADASVIATAERLSILRILTLDERHFRAVKPRGSEHFIILPADAAAKSGQSHKKK